MLERMVCPIEFKDTDELCLFPCCSHVFNLDCIDVWLASQITCLICHANLVEQAVNDNLNLLHITTHTIDATILQPEIVASPQDHVTIVMDPLQKKE